ncbi:GDP-L-fucose synthase family protein [Burkholderia vietnamiensis]|uniref:GDP-L-fucose synthase n=1 Tax=Burkholderia vietnamiensis (strain G4 / LMG 22486) TaxID=269482 RepID=A4JT16_BURVG|nr:GDP-L-fucose synthase [Burkholderia vietnamiensis]ABO59419.1 NAD-dependent epimerase/dehydratase [Burkholderia vietnamiensis G4]AOK02746.1 GDP-fucose synthetase [Burkholderia vietnamiensis]AOK45184.1 GDP-fucose synthetase [Burkholderia vietnamiensis]KVR84652.1 GDP-fucose synthetase [Burkholderia vietnamiensis]KVS37833.1 GDP-fucose synthetase [Burkholderia vietnamiensis]
MNKNTRIFVAGHRGMVGSAVVRNLDARGYVNVVTRGRSELDLTNQNAVEEFFRTEAIEVVVLAAAKVGGILANDTYPADFLYLNLMIEANVIHAAYRSGVQRLVFLGSSCIYPRDCPQPIKEAYLLSGPLEKTNEPYAIAKIAGIKLCESYNRQYGTRYVSLMPTNLYGPNDNYDLRTSHVLPALLRKAHEAKVEGRESLTVWGTGRVRREFLHVDDMADATIFALEVGLESGLYNVGCGSDVTIEELAREAMQAVGFNGRIEFDTTKPDGTPQKLLDVGLLAQLGWRAKIGLREGLASTYQEFLQRHDVAVAERI